MHKAELLVAHKLSYTNALAALTSTGRYSHSGVGIYNLDCRSFFSHKEYMNDLGLTDSWLSMR